MRTFGNETGVTHDRQFWSFALLFDDHAYWQQEGTWVFNYQNSYYFDCFLGHRWIHSD